MSDEAEIPQDEAEVPNDEVEEVKETLLAKRPKPKLAPGSGLSTGSTLLNLACTDTINAGFLPGKFYFFVGDSSSGKSFLTMTCLAEACANPAFGKYRLIHDDVERGVCMDLEYFYGSKLANRLEPPSGTKEKPEYSSTVEEFYYHLDDALDDKRPFIYILDSMDGLATDDESAQFDKEKEAHAKEKEVSGNYGTSKAKKNSAYMRLVHNRLPEKGSILIVISQTRENIGYGAQFNPKTRAGGKALTFYSALEMWSSVKKKIKMEKTVDGRKIDRELGTLCQIRVKKNRLSGKDRTVEIPIYHSYGVDDLGSCVDFLISEGFWIKAKGGKIHPKGFFGKDDEKIYTYDKLLSYIQEQGLEKELRLTVQEAWNTIEEACFINRKPRYD